MLFEKQWLRAWHGEGVSDILVHQMSDRYSLTTRPYIFDEIA
jgi:hypothetical protein